MGWKIGIDIGGTFTDVVAVDNRGQVVTEKAFTTPEDPAQGVLQALEQLARRLGEDLGRLLAEAERVAHGTTISTNALIQRKGAKVGLITTRGFEDTLAIGRGPVARTGGLPPALAMDFAHTVAPPPLVPRERIRGIRERVAADGAVLHAPDPEEVVRAVQELLAQGIESLAVVLLWSFLHPAHEKLVAAIARELAPAMPVSLSSEVAPQLGEFERTVTTVVNAYVAPTTARYLQRLSRDLAESGFSFQLEVMTSGGGVIGPGEAIRHPVRLINSGPVGGIVAGKHLGEQLGCRRLITADMGGTSFDVGVVVDGQWQTDAEPFLGHGLPSVIEAIRIATIGAGGGSIAWTDGHRLYVGPESAGSVPGPAAYGRGGTRPTVTDALVSLGFIHPERFFGGRFPLQSQRAYEAIRTQIAEPLHLSVEDAASGIYEVVTATMADLIRKETIEHGFDPREFVLVAFGGAAGCHAAKIADYLGIPRVIIPATAAAFSAHGIARSELRWQASQSIPLHLDGQALSGLALDEAFHAVVARVEEGLRASGVLPEQAEWRYGIDVRYRGQLHALTVAWPKAHFRPDEVPDLREAFEALYERRFGRGSARARSPLEVMGVRAEAVASRMAAHGESHHLPAPLLPPPEDRAVYLRGEGWLQAKVIREEALSAGEAVWGPAILERADTTIWIPPGHVGRKLGGHLEIHPQGGR